jgi:ADP-heptose:LPS heptosyltransferase
VTYLETKSILNVARLIADAKQFVGNQGLPHALAEAMNIQLTCEVDKVYPAAVFPNKPSSTYV